MTSNEPALYIGCGCVVTDSRGRYLLVRETKAIARGRLALPGGGLEANESLHDAAVREVREETGLIVDAVALLGIFHCALTSEGSYGTNFIFEGRIVDGEVTVSDEHPEIVWKTLSEIEALHADGMVRGGHVVQAIGRSERGEQLPSGLITEVSASD